MNIAEFCIKNNRTLTVLFALVVVAGVNTFNTVGRLENPDFTIRAAQITTRFPGASPQKVEELVTDRIEERLRTIPELKLVSSQSLNGLSLITVEAFDKFKDMAPIWRKVRNRVDDVTPTLPDGVRPPSVNDEFGDVFGIVIALTADGYSYREMKDAADTARDALLALPSVAKVDLSGTQEERIFIEYSDAQLAEYGITPYHLAQVLQGQNSIRAGGTAYVEGESVVLEPTGAFENLGDIQRMTIRLPGSQETVYLEDLARVRRGFVDPPTTMARFNGERAIMLAINMAEGENIVRMGEQVDARLHELISDIPIGLDFHRLAYEPTVVTRSINDFMMNLYQAIFFVVVVMLMFAGIRMGLIAGALIPMAMLLAIALLPLFDIKLQKISIASLIISLGMLVDNGVVVSESILVRLTSGEDRLKAVTASVRELMLPLLAASGTTICAFLPIGIADSATGEYCFSLFVVVTLSLLASWVFSMTLVPMLCYYFMKVKQVRAATYDGRFYRKYRSFLIACLKHRLVFLTTLLAIFVVSLVCFRFVPKLFFPPNEREVVFVDVWMPYGTDIRATSDRVEELEAFILQQESVDTVGTYIGSSGPRWYLSQNVQGRNPNYAYVLVNTKTIEDAPELVSTIREWSDNNVPDARIRSGLLENGPPVGYPIQLRLSGDELGALYRARDHIASLMSKVPGLMSIHDDWGEWTKTTKIDVNQDAANRAGLTTEDVAMSLNTQISGLEATELREGDGTIPVILRSNDSYREDIGRLDSLNIYSYSTSGSVPLLSVARPILEWQPSLIRRRNEQRAMTISCDVQGRFAADALNELLPHLDDYTASNDWPSGFSLEVGGEFESSNDASASIAAAFPLAFGALSLILIGQFNSIRRPLIIALTVPPMMIGITWGMLITQAPFGFMAMLGMISLMGIIVNNAIMMIDCIEIERAGGRSTADAIVGAAQQRMRPIVMTACTTIVGLIPLSLQGGEFWRPMANCIIFGLAFATILTLILCPVLYSLFFQTSFKNYAWTKQTNRS